MKKEFMPIHIRVEKKQLLKVKFAADLLNITMTKFVENAINTYMETIDLKQLAEKRLTDCE